MQLTTQEVEQYIRLTLRQHGYTHLKIDWLPCKKSYLGRACVREDKIELNKRILNHFRLFHEVLLHELAHFIQWERNGKKFFRKNNRWQLHGADFKAVCKELKIPARAQIDLQEFY